jgi:hypothetical protein
MVGALTISASAARATEGSVGGGESSTTLSIKAHPAKVARTIRTGTKYLNCQVSVNDPHYSKGAKGVIAKVRYTCTGNVKGSLSLSGYMNVFKAGQYGPFPSQGSNAETRVVGPGSAGTMYVPHQDRNGLRCYGSYYYQAFAKSTLRALGQSKTDRLNSGAKRPKCP